MSLVSRNQRHNRANPASVRSVKRCPREVSKMLAHKQGSLTGPAMYPAWIADHQGIRRYIPGDHGSGSGHGELTNCDACKYNCPSPTGGNSDQATGRCEPPVPISSPSPQEANRCTLLGE